jgi:pimeloyl-ACP methyl ester carboxylesterase
MNMLRSLTLLVLTLHAGCQTGPENRSFPLTVDGGVRAIEAMAEAPRSLERPVVLVGGYADPGLAPTDLARRLGVLFNVPDGIDVTFKINQTFDGCRATLIAAVDEQYPNDDTTQTIEVDVIAHSMGGLVSTYAGDPTAGARRLRIRRLFTIATPFRGTTLADEITTKNALIVDMRPSSDFIRRINERAGDIDYELVPYTSLGDEVVPPASAAPVGQVPIWVPARPFRVAHMAFQDPRINADIARRLRGETPYATEPRTPLPVEDDDGG